MIILHYSSKMQWTLILIICLLYRSIEKCSSVSFHRTVFRRVSTPIKSMPSRCALYFNLSTRGGGRDDLNATTDVEDSTLHVIDERQLIGFIDVTSNAEADIILLIGSGKKIHKDSTGRILMDRAIFSVSSEYHEQSATGETTQEEIGQMKAAAAALTIGSTCQTIYLVLSYDFKDGKTVLHRTLGGIKLMNLIDGVRKRWNDSPEAPLTKLVLLLVPLSDVKSGAFSFLSPEISDQNFLDLSQCGWKSKGIKFLIGRLKTYFELGGDDFKNVDPFEDLSVFLLGKSKELLHSGDDVGAFGRSDANDVLETVRCHIQLHSANKVNAKQIDTKNFQTKVKNRYESFGGVGAPVFSK